MVIIEKQHPFLNMDTAGPDFGSEDDPFTYFRVLFE